MNSRNQIAIASCIATVLLSHTAFAAPLKSLARHVPAIVSKLQPAANLGETNLNLAIGLPLHNQGALSNLLADLQNPASPQFHHYLTPAEFTARFGPTQEEYDSVVQFAKASGFNVTALHEDRMLIEVTADTKNIETAFNLHMQKYQHPTENRLFYAPDAEPSVPEGLPVVDVDGLNNFALPHPVNFHRKVIGKPSVANGPKAYNVSMDGSGPNGNFIGSDYRQMYVPGTTLTGAGQTVGLFEFDDFYPSDISTYESLADITNPPPVSNVLLGGYNGAPGDADGEVALDIEMAMSMAPGLQGILVFATSSSGSALTILSSMSSSTYSYVKQFSSSWSFGSPTRTTMDSYFQKMQAQGQSFFEASGDSGAYDSGALPIPQDDPYITEVGGTAVMTAETNGAWMNEIVWNAPDYGDASSGGVSTSYAIPSWQGGVNTTSNGASSAFRNSPDVAAVADNIFIVADDGEDESTGGTSAAAPLWAAFTALANQYAVSVGHTNLGFLNPTLYSLYGRRTNIAYTANFNDITFGNSTNTVLTKFFATVGYDLCTGLGSPIGNTLIQSLVSPDGFTVVPGQGFTGSGAVGGPFTVTNQAITLSNSGSASLTWSAVGVPTWLTLSTTGGTLAAGTAQTVTASLNAAASALVSGVYTSNVLFSNATSGQSQVHQFTVRANQNLIHDGGFESDDFAYWVVSGAAYADYNDFVDTGYYTGYSPYSGNCFAVFGQTNSLAYITQQFRTDIGVPYLISFYLANPQGLPTNAFRVQFATSTTTNILFNQSNLGGFDYQNYQFLAVATATNSALQFGGRNDPDAFLLDEVSVTPVPLPTIVSYVFASGTVTLTWNSLPGFQYEVESAPSLSPDQWTILTTVTATDVTTSDTETVPGGTSQFYRVVLLPIVP